MSGDFLIDKRSDAQIKKQITYKFVNKVPLTDKESSYYPLVESLSRITRLLGSKTNCLSEKYFRYIVDQLGIVPLTPTPAEVPMVFTLAKNIDQYELPAGTVLSSSTAPELIFETSEDLSVRNNSVQSLTVEDYIRGKYNTIAAVDSQISDEVSLVDEGSENIIYSREFQITGSFAETDLVFLEISCPEDVNAQYYVDDSLVEPVADYSDLFVNETAEDVFSSLAGISSESRDESRFIKLSVVPDKTYKFEIRTQDTITSKLLIGHLNEYKINYYQYSIPDRILVDGKNVLSGADSKHFTLNQDKKNVFYYGSTRGFSADYSTFYTRLDVKVFWEGMDKSVSVFKASDVDMSEYADENFFEIEKIEYFDGLIWNDIIISSGSEVTKATCELTYDEQVQIEIRIENINIPLAKIAGVESRWIRITLGNESKSLVDTIIADNYSDEDDEGFQYITAYAQIMNAIEAKEIGDAQFVENFKISENFGDYDLDTQNDEQISDSIALYFEIDKLCTEKTIDWYFLLNPQTIVRDIDTQISLKWQYSLGSSWNDIDDVFDGTVAFSKSGRITFEVGSDISLDEERNCYLVRCLISISGSDSAKSLEIFDEIEFTGIYSNFVFADGISSDEDDLTFSSSGKSEQEFSLGESCAIEFDLYVNEPIAHGEGGLSSEDDNVVVLWTKVDHFLESGALDRHYVVDYRNNKISFGDGVNGCIPPAGDSNIILKNIKRIVADCEDAEIGAVDKLSKKNPSIKACTNIGKATGYFEPMAEDEYYETASVRLKHGNRAVTYSDIEQLLYEAFTEIYSVKAFYDIDIDKVKIVVVPKLLEDLRTNDKLLTRVNDYILERNVTNKFVCVYPTLVPIDYNIQYTESTEENDVITAQVKAAIENFFSPSTGGQDGKGWPVGRDVYKSEISWAIRGILGSNLYKIETTPEMSSNSYISLGKWEYPDIGVISVTEVVES